MSETTTKNTGGERKSTRRTRGGSSTGPSREEVINLTNGRISENHKNLSLIEEIKPKPDMDPIGSLPKDKVAEGATGNNSWPPTFKNVTPKDMPSKTPVSILQEVLSRKGMTPKYELLQEEGAIHEPTFRYRVTVEPDLIATGTGRSKKEAKHAAAKSILDKLKETTEMMFSFPEFKMDVSGTSVGEGEGCENPIGVLQELCMSKRWPPPTYHTEREEGLPHERQFTIACTVFRYKETGTGKSKKIAKRLAAHKMLVFLRGIPSEDKYGASFGLDDEDELAQQLSQVNVDGNDLKNFKTNMLSNLKVTQFRKSLKASNGPKLIELQNMNLSDRDIDYKNVLKEIADEQIFIVTYVDIEEVSASGMYQCLVQLSTVPVTVCGGKGKTVEEAQVDAALWTLSFLKLMSRK